eukprot:CAMPEP_0119142070 /NCGR_PEP_ID=MMETSP1310-20130426/32037_1 /TAXON_ID=464262 /ORGANISM="Genus nov. species nov., Strain RCC2339" /LENGTH=227 /DNA_ID=CAMNT_0007133581 /DNA_START=75 /DNA_END=755 /DNA_ORIENTATION=-
MEDELDIFLATRSNGRHVNVAKSEVATVELLARFIAKESGIPTSWGEQGSGEVPITFEIVLNTWGAHIGEYQNDPVYSDPLIYKGRFGIEYDFQLGTRTPLLLSKLDEKVSLEEVLDSCAQKYGAGRMKIQGREQLYVTFTLCEKLQERESAFLSLAQWQHRHYVWRQRLTKLAIFGFGAAAVYAILRGHGLILPASSPDSRFMWATVGWSMVFYPIVLTAGAFGWL